MRLVTTAVPSIAPSHSAVAWHPSRSGIISSGPLRTLAGSWPGSPGPPGSTWKAPRPAGRSPITSPFSREQIFLVVNGSEDLSDQQTFLLSVLAQLCGTVIASQELITAERERLSQIAALNAELEETVSALARRMEIHRSLTEIAASGGEAGIAAILHQLTRHPVLIVDVQGQHQGGRWPGAR